MKNTFLMLGALLLIAVFAPVHATDEEDIAAMLNEFLWGASVGSPSAHDRFWSDDLVYTSSAGARTDKETIMRGMRDVQEPPEDHIPEVVYTAEDVDIRVYGDSAVVAFRLLGTVPGDPPEVDQYFNTGTLVRQEDGWRVVAWQATRIPEAEEADSSD